ncbi:hypothetical protein BR93DRAFT_965330 [Coniochaeta sp. PMI_546]|nr:hypothetical protein BR93DRAFT_965330 [Coniochaeta sp. PMI_546]
MPRPLSEISNPDYCTMSYTEPTEREPQDELDLDEAQKSWVGPPVSRASMEFLLNYPPSLELPPGRPYNLGKVFFKVILIDREEGRRYFLGHLAQFFPFQRYVSEDAKPSADEFYHPYNFLPDLFRETIHTRLGLGDVTWTLWMVLDQSAPAIRIVDDPALLDALVYLNEWYLKKDPWSHHMIWFLVEIDDPETKKRFSKLRQPQRMSPSDDKNQTPRASYSPEYLQDTSQSSGAEDTPGTSAFAEYPYGETSEDEELRQMATAQYVDPAKLPARLSLGFKPHSPPQAEPADEPGVLESIDTDAKKGTDVMDGDLDSILPVAGTPTDEEWRAMCSFLALEADKHKNPIIRSVPIPYTNIYLTPRQYEAALAMLHCRGSRGIFGGVLADVPGTGKTHTCIAAVLFRALVAYNMAEVKKEWETREYESSKGKGSRSREFRHLPPDARKNEVCPCGDPQGILCYAHADGITRDIGDTMSRGVSLILAPQGVIEEWKSVFANSLMNRKFFEPCLIHTTSVRELACPPNFEKRFQLKVTPRQDGFPKGYKPQVMDMDYTYTIDTEPGKQPERFIIITTHQIEKLREQFQVPVMVTVASKKERMSVYGLPVGCMMVDEFHKVRAATTPVVELAQEHKRIMRYNTEFWSVSGTIMPKSSFTDLESTIAILQRPPWTQPAHRYYNSRVDCAKELENAYFEAVSADKGSEAAVEAFEERARQFFEGLIIRHTMDSRFFGKRITNVKEMKPVKKTFTTPAEYLEDVQTLANQVKDKIRGITQSDSYEQVVRSLQTYVELTPLQVASTFPGAARIILQDKIRFDLTSLRGLIKKAKGDVTNVKEFTDLTDAIVAGSTKLEEVVLIFLRMEEDHQSRPKSDDGSGKKLRNNRQMKKLVIVTPTLGEAVFMYLGLKERLAPIKGAKIVLLHADLLASEKQRMTNDFQALTPGSAKILVTPYEVGGTGLNLQTANYQVLTGPLRTKDYELQAFARTNREGNMLRLHHWLYLTDDNPADRLIIARQANRRVASDPFDMGDEFKVEMEKGE